MKLNTIMLAVAPAMVLASCAGWYTGVNGGPATLDAKQTEIVTKELAGKTAGPAQRCVNSRLLDQPVKVSDGVILYRVGQKLVYRNDLRGECSGLANDSAFMLLRNTGSGMDSCEGDIIRMVDRSGQFERGACAFGAFVPYRSS